MNTMNTMNIMSVRIVIAAVCLVLACLRPALAQRGLKDIPLPDPAAELAELYRLLPGYRFYTLGPEKPELGLFDDRAVQSKLFRADIIALPGGASTCPTGPMQLPA